MIRSRRLWLTCLILVLLSPRSPARAQTSLLDPSHDALACAFHVACTVPPDRQPKLVQRFIAWEYLALDREKEAREVARILADPAFRADVQAACGTKAFRAADARQTARWMAAATRTARRARSPESRCQAWCGIGQAYRLQNRPDDALRILDRLCDHAGGQPCEGVTQLAEDLSNEMVRLGRIEKTRQILSCIPVGVGFHYGELAVRLAEFGHLDEAFDVLATAPQLPGYDEHGRVLCAGVAYLAGRGQWSSSLALVDSLGPTVRAADAIAVVAAKADTAGDHALADSLYPVALDRLLTARPVLSDQSLPEELFGRLAVALGARRDFDKALVAARALPLRDELDQNDRATRALALGRIGVELRRAGHTERSVEVLEEARVVAEGFPDDSLRCTLILAQISQQFFDAGFPDLSRQYLGLAIDWNRRLGPRQQGFALADLAACPGDIRDDEECSRLLVEALRAAAAITDVENQSRVLMDLGDVQLRNHLQLGREGQRILAGIVRRRGPVWRANLSLPDWIEGTGRAASGSSGPP